MRTLRQLEFLSWLHWIFKIIFCIWIVKKICKNALNSQPRSYAISIYYSLRTYKNVSKWITIVFSFELIFNVLLLYRRLKRFISLAICYCPRCSVANDIVLKTFVFLEHFFSNTRANKNAPFFLLLNVVS